MLYKIKTMAVCYRWVNTRTSLLLYAYVCRLLLYVLLPRYKQIVTRRHVFDRSIVIASNSYRGCHSASSTRPSCRRHYTKLLHRVIGVIYYWIEYLDGLLSCFYDIIPHTNMHISSFIFCEDVDTVSITTTHLLLPIS